MTRIFDFIWPLSVADMRANYCRWQRVEWSFLSPHFQEFLQKRIMGILGKYIGIELNESLLTTAKADLAVMVHHVNKQNFDIRITEEKLYFDGRKLDVGLATEVRCYPRELLQQIEKVDRSFIDEVKQIHTDLR